MAIKKITLLAVLIVLIQSIGFAQLSTDWGWDWKDSSKVPAKRIPQFNAFKQNKYPYPAKPRDQYELGLSAGTAYLFADVAPLWGYGFGLSVRKSLGNAISARIGYNYMVTKGLDYIARGNTLRPGQANYGIWDKYYTSQGKTYFANYKNKTSQGSIDFIYSLNSLSHFRGNPKWDHYLFIGYSLVVADVDVDALDSKGKPYDFYKINPYRRKQDIRKDLKNLLKGSYNMNAATVNQNRNDRGFGFLSSQFLIRQGFDFGAGTSYKLNKKWNIGVEQKFTNVFSNELDGMKATDGIYKLGLNDIYSYTSFHINYNLGKSSKRVEPLWWINPNNYIYSELNEPKHAKKQAPVLPDADGDGVTDQFDKEPNTPAGASVDQHGRALDTDGDGVPDYKDKEPLTATKCFPVNADGVGICPEPPCCSSIKGLQDQIDSLKKYRPTPTPSDCSISDLPSIQFKNGAILSKQSKSLLEAVAVKLKANPGCRVKVIGHPMADKPSQQRSWERVNEVIKYLVEKQGISESRFIFSYEGGEGDVNTIDLQPTTEDGPGFGTVPAPHPNLK